MQLQHLELHNFWRLQKFAGVIAPFTAVVGPNGSGKTTIRKSIEFAFCGGTLDAGRGKDNAALLLHNGADAGLVKVLSDGVEIARDVASGKTVGPEPKLPATLPFVLRADEFAKDSTDRRTVLFSVMGLSTGPEEIVRRLLDKGCDKGMVDAVKHLLGPGIFAAAITEAERQRLQQKGAWCEVTGRGQYGSKIAAEWGADLPTVTLESLEAQYGPMSQVVDDIPLWRNIIAAQNKLLGELKVYEDNQAKLPGLKEQGKQHATLTEKLKNQRQQYNDLKAQYEAIGAALVQQPAAEASATPKRRGKGAQTVGGQQIHEIVCDHCGAINRKIYGNGVFTTAPEAAPADPEPKRELTTEETSQRDNLQNQMAEMSRQMGITENKIRECDAALALAAEIEKQTLRPELSEASQRLSEAEDGLRECQEAEAQMKAARDGAEQAQVKTDRAYALHLGVQKWEHLLKELGPDGVPKDILSAALDPLDNLLQVAAEATGWPKVELDENLNIYAGGYVYRMLSESYQYRADAHLAWAIAKLSGINMLLLDRADVLDLAGRAELMNWLYQESLDNGFQTILFMTLKQQPNLPEEGTAVFWLGDVPEA
jgi:hypothetical protein